jgi:prepilin-type N-terminal cleavage/methylation domain-containing protein
MLLKNKRGFTIIELLVVIVLCGIILTAVLGLYLTSDKVFKQTRPISDVLEEARSAVATLDFVFSRWGVGVPCKNNNCTIEDFIPLCNGYPPTNPLCMNCINPNGSLNSTTSCKGVAFYANLLGHGFVVSTNNGTANLISCRLSMDPNDNYYYIWQGEKVVNYNGTGKPPIYQLSELDPDGQDCIENFNGNPNAQSSALVNGTAGNYTLQPGNFITRVPYEVRLYPECKSDGCWLYLEKIDMAKNNNVTTKLVKLKDLDSFKVSAQGRAIKVELEIQSQSKPEKVLKIERYFAR